jgi:hypothetical protein
MAGIASKTTTVASACPRTTEHQERDIREKNMGHLASFWVRVHSRSALSSAHGVPDASYDEVRDDKTEARINRISYDEVRVVLKVIDEGAWNPDPAS